jgi:hypothetical protein
LDINYNLGALREFETAFDGEMEANPKTMEYIVNSEI